MLTWARVALSLDGALPFIAVVRLLTISSQDPHLQPTLKSTWSLLAWLSIAFVGLFAVSNIFPRPHGPSRYIVTAPPPADDGKDSSESD